MLSIQRIQELASENRTIDEITEELGISKTRYKKFCKQNDYHKPRPTKLSNEEKQKIKEMLGTNLYKKTAICALYNISYQTLMKCLE